MSFRQSPQKERIEKIKEKLDQIQVNNEVAKGTLLDEVEQQVNQLNQELDELTEQLSKKSQVVEQDV